MIEDEEFKELLAREVIRRGRRCSRTTKTTGKPCNNASASQWTSACRLHETDEDRRLAQIAQEAFSEGIRWGKHAALGEVDRLVTQRVRAELAARPCKHYRTHAPNGHQIVVVETGYTYEWAGDEPVEVGDAVFVPGPYWVPHAPSRVVKVTSLSSDYQGDLVAIDRKATPEEAEALA